ncbi:MAG TPA: efflux RND transporter periplasmic adaptor subunit [Steroidobacteraceae bacterium]|nr:efflux RND transporter periplasmic adaptor subunit [Steroidobacteraceae bacterium]
MRILNALALAGLLLARPALPGPVAGLTVGTTTSEGYFAATGTVEAVRQGTLGAQVSGRVAEVLVRAGDEVAAGQALVRIEADEAQQGAAASSAAAAGAAARLASAQADHERALKLRAQEYISDAAMQRAEAAWRSAQAEAEASGATARAAMARAGWYTVRAPYAGHVTDLWVSAGDTATPGRPLVGIYAPGALRVVARIPETIGSRLLPGASVRVEFGGDAGSGAALTLASWRAVPAVDPATHSIEVRVDLPAATRIDPGQFARLLLPVRAAAAEIRVPLQAVVHRSEVTAVYVIEPQGGTHLRQVRLGPVVGEAVTVLAGLQPGERIVADPNGAGTP